MDSTLLRDCVRAITRLAKEVKTVFCADDPLLVIHDHNRVARRLAFKIVYAKKAKERRKHYRKLFKVTNDAVVYGYMAMDSLQGRKKRPAARKKLAKELETFCLLALDVINQATRRVIKGASVSANEKVVSIFEPHTDVIVKDRRETRFGHKIFIAAGKSGIITDCVIERGNPADSELFEKLIARHKERFGVAPKQTAADGGFASKENLRAAKGMGVKDCIFHKKRGLTEEQMADSPWIYKKLRNFRAGVEAVISWGKRSFGLDRCVWKGWDSFQSYVMSGVVAHNLVVMAKALIAQKQPC